MDFMSIKDFIIFSSIGSINISRDPFTQKMQLDADLPVGRQVNAETT